MIKSELVTKVAERANLSKADADLVITTVFDEITRSLIDGKRVELRGFGVLSVRNRNARQARNPKTGAPVKVEAKRVPFFKAGKSVTNALNHKG